MYRFLHSSLAWLLTALYKVEVQGLEHFHNAGNRVLIVSNHTSFLDALLLAVFLPERLTFAIDTHHAKRWYGRLSSLVVDLFPVNPLNPLSTKSLIKLLRDNHKAVIFPEGRITVTGSLMKIYQGTGLIADKSEAQVLPVRIDGAQYTPFSRLRGQVRLRWLPKITLTVMPPRRINIPPHITGRARRDRAGRMLTDIMTELIFATSQRPRTLFQALLDVRRIHGGNHIIVEDIERKPRTYNQLLQMCYALGRKMTNNTAPNEAVGLLLPSAIVTVAVFFGLQLFRRIPAMLNFTLGPQAVVSATNIARIRTVYTSRRFIEHAKLDPLIAALKQHVTVHYLEDVRDNLSLMEKITALVATPFLQLIYRRIEPTPTPHSAAVILFTSGSEGTPKGVVLSHDNLLSNLNQMSARVDFSAQDIILNTLPLFHSFGLTAGTILPLLSGMRTFFYPNPLHYRIVPEIAYDINATLLFGTNTFLAGYAKHAHPYDFYSVRYVFAGAEKLKDEVRHVWEEKFGVRIFEGYGATETSPVLAVNTAMENKPGSVGRFLPGIEHRLEPVTGIAQGGRLHVTGPNVMLGYLLTQQPGEIVPPHSSAFGAGWYDTGDIVSVDDNGFVTIQGRAKRFAKIGGEMVSLTAVEALASRTWPEAIHAVIAVPDAQKGEQLILITNEPSAARARLLEQARHDGIGELNVPRQLHIVKEVPLLGTGKIDYPGVTQLIAACKTESETET